MRRRAQPSLGLSPLPVLRERARVRVPFPIPPCRRYPTQAPSPFPLPDYSERGKTQYPWWFFATIICASFVSLPAAIAQQGPIVV